MKKINKVTVIIPTYNAEKFIGRCIDTVISQIYENVEIIAIDDGSSDNTINILKEFKKIKVLENETNQGPAYSRTKGLMQASGEYVAFLDADDYWDEDFISATVAFLEKYEDAVAVSTGYIGIDLKGGTVEKPKLSEEDKAYYGEKGNICPDFFEFWSTYFGVLTGTVMMRTSVAQQTKGQRSELRLTEKI
ncbi:glycosyltransferase family 2 protein [Sulfurovum riftiae]|nr:glycosyltransferase family 2 protein [Sulfurovum riftiae]